MTPEDLENILELEYETRYNPRKILRVIFAIVSLNLGVMLLTRGSAPTHSLFGTGALTFFVWLGFGSPVDTVLTKESVAKVRDWLQTIDTTDNTDDK